MHQLPRLMAQESHTGITALIWGFSLILQSLLFALLFYRGVARKFPLFTSLIGFYLVRSTLLYLIFGYIDAQDYNRLYNFLLLLDILVQAGVVFEIIFTLIRERGGLTPRRVFIPLVLACVAVAATYLTVAMLPHTPIPTDRSQFFFSYLLILLCGWTFAISSPSDSDSDLLRTVTLGFALYGIVNVAASIGRTVAAAHGHHRSYATWSYVLAGAYLTVITFWLVALKRPTSAASPAPLQGIQLTDDVC